MVYQKKFKNDVDELVKQKLHALLTPVNMPFIVSLDKVRGIVYIGGEKTDDVRLKNLKAEAEFFLASDLWKILNETAKMLAQKSMFEMGESLDDMKKGRSLLYLLDSQNKAIEIFKNYLPKK